MAKKNKRNIVQDAIEHNDVGCIPYWIQIDRSLGRKMAGYYGVDSIDEYLDNGIELIDMTALPDILFIDPPSLKGGNFPQHLFSELLDRIKAQAGDCTNKYRVADLGGLWTQAASLRGMNKLMDDLIYQPNFVHELLDGILDVFLANVATCRNDIDCILLSDGFGFHNDIVSPENVWQEYMQTRLQRLGDIVHAYDLHFALSISDTIEPIVADIVSMGIDILKPEKTECIDILKVKREYGQYITLWGVYGTSGTLLFSTPEYVRDEVNKLYEYLGKGGGFIFSPDEIIQNDVPLENVRALVDVAIERESGKG